MNGIIPVSVFKIDPSHKTKKQKDINTKDSISLIYDLGFAFLLSSHFQSHIEMGISTNNHAEGTKI
jgi:hypothetical protein